LLIFPVSAWRINDGKMQSRLRILDDPGAESSTVLAAIERMAMIIERCFADQQQA
jgi:hypothetical protein